MCAILSMILFNTQENQASKMRQSKEKGGQMGKSYPVLFDCKTQALKHCAPLHLETTLAHVGVLKSPPVPQRGSYRQEAGNRKQRNAGPRHSPHNPET